MFTVTAPLRGSDDYGAGHFGAPRGDHTHNGMDFAAAKDSGLMSSVSGEVTKHGYPYADDLSFRYIEITDENDFRHRFFYVKPSHPVGAIVSVGQVIGQVQDIAGRYSDKHMKNHFHYEIKSIDGGYLDPELFV